MHRTLYTLLLLFACFTFYGQTPPSLHSFINYPIDFTTQLSDGSYPQITVSDIQDAFTLAHRAEESQFCLAINSITDWQMPSQSIWDNTPRNEKVLFLINKERTARAGLDYCIGQGPVLGLPLIGIEENINTLSQEFSDHLITFSAQVPTMDDTLRHMIDVEPELGCLQPAGNCCNEFKEAFILNAWRNQIPSHTREFEAYIVYMMIYMLLPDLRELILLQDEGNLNYIGQGFTNNYGHNSDEGFVGIGISIDSTTYGPLTYDYTFVLSYLDPVPESVGCNYNCITCLDCPSTLTENNNPISEGIYQAESWVQSAGNVHNSVSVTLRANNYVQLNQNFEVSLGGILNAYIDGCSNY